MNRTPEPAADIVTHELTRLALSKIHGAPDLKLLEKIETLLNDSIDGIDRHLSRYGEDKEELTELLTRGLEQLGIELCGLRQELNRSNDQILEQDIAVEKKLLALEDSLASARKETFELAKKIKSLPIELEANLTTMPLEDQKRSSLPMIVVFAILLTIQTFIIKPDLVQQLLNLFSLHIS